MIYKLPVTQQTVSQPSPRGLDPLKIAATVIGTKVHEGGVSMRTRRFQEALRHELTRADQSPTARAKDL